MDVAEFNAWMPVDADWARGPLPVAAWLIDRKFATSAEPTSEDGGLKLNTAVDFVCVGSLEGKRSNALPPLGKTQISPGRGH